MRKERRNLVVQGKGWLRYKNTSGADLVLPRPLSNGRSMVFKDAYFEADDSFIGQYGVKVIEDLGKNFKKPLVEQKQEPAPQLLVDDASSKLEFYEPDGQPLNESKKSNDVSLSKKELVEFATLKGIEVNPNWSKEKILAVIREKK